MPIASVELILFAVQAGIKLIQTGRNVYKEETIGGEVSVLLPPAFKRSPLNMALDFASSLETSSDADKKQRFNDFYKDAKTTVYEGAGTVKANAEWQLVQQYIADMAKGMVPSARPDGAGVTSLLVIKQWERGESPFPSPIQRVAGSLVEISIDYFVQVPGALNENSKQGKALKSFLTGLSDFDFQDTRWDSIVIALFTTALDTFKDHPDLITDEADDQSLVRQIVGGVALDVQKKLSGSSVGDLNAEANLKRFSQIVLRSLLKNGGTAITESPSILGLKEGGQVMVQAVGSVFLDILLGKDDDPLTAGLKQIASTESFDKLIRAALKAAMEHPDYFISTGHPPINLWLRGILSDIYKLRDGKTFFDPELFADIAYSVLDNGLRDLPLLLNVNGTAPALLIDVVQKVFTVLTDGESARWKNLQFSRSDLKDVFNCVLTSLVTNLPWFSKRPDIQEEALAIVPLTIEVLSDLDQDSLKTLLRSGRLSAVIAAVLASEVLKPGDLQDRKKIIMGIKAVLDEVVAGGISNAGHLLDEQILYDLLRAISNSGVAVKIFDGKNAEIKKVIEKLIPILEELRQGQILTISGMAERLK